MKKGFMIDNDFIEKYWYAYIYEQLENYTNDVDFILKVLNDQLGNTSQKILEVACGGGRISIPLAQAGCDVTGIDKDEYMLMRFYKRMHLLGMTNIRCMQQDITIYPFYGERDYDVVIIASNVMVNIETEQDYKQAQSGLIYKASSVLKSGGHLYLSFNLLHDPNSVFNKLQESHYFEGTDDMGTYGRTCSYGSVYDPVTQICTGASHWEVTANNGERKIIPHIWHKHIPKFEQIQEILDDAGFIIKRTYKNFTDEPFPNPIDETAYEITIWAEKNRT